LLTLIIEQIFSKILNNLALKVLCKENPPFWDPEKWDCKKSIQKIDKWNNLQIFKKLEQISTLWRSLLQTTIQWKALQMALESNECQKDVEWGAQEMFVKVYINNLKFLTRNTSNEAY
jgi:hypothetical protein